MVCVRAGGVYEILPDLDENPDTITFNAHAGTGAYGILRYRDHVVKPYEDIYHLLEKRFNLTPGKTVFIDDTAVNIDTARAIGWKGIVFESYEQVERELKSLGVCIHI